MKIIRIYNNNILSALNHDQEVILTGNGIGFQKQSGDQVDVKKIDKMYTFENQQKSQFAHLIQRTPLIFFKISEAIIFKAEKELNIKLSDQIIISLTDHLYYAVERKKKDILSPNLMFNEIKVLYKDEYKIGLWSLKLIAANTKIILDAQEASYIAMHIVNATLGSNVGSAAKILRFVKSVQGVIEKTFGIAFDDNELDFSRLLTHLKFMAHHILFQDEKITGNLDDMYELLIKEPDKMEICIQAITSLITKDYNYDLQKYEKVYLMMHIRKIVSL